MLDVSPREKKLLSIPSEVYTPTSKPPSLIQSENGWTTYTNSLQDYSIKYPSTYIIDPHSKEDGCLTLYSTQDVLDRQSQYPTINELEVSVCSAFSNRPVGYEPKTYTSLRQYVHEGDHESGLVVGNVSWMSINTFEVAKEKMGDTDRYYWLHNGILYYIDVQPNNSKLQKEVDQILSTFQFAQ